MISKRLHLLFVVMKMQEKVIRKEFLEEDNNTTDNCVFITVNVLLINFSTQETIYIIMMLIILYDKYICLFEVV